MCNFDSHSLPGAENSGLSANSIRTGSTESLQDVEARIHALRSEANRLELAYREAHDLEEYTAHATVTVDIDVTATVWADSQEAAEQVLEDALHDYSYGVFCPEPGHERLDISNVEFAGERVEDVLVESCAAEENDQDEHGGGDE